MVHGKISTTNRLLQKHVIPYKFNRILRSVQQDLVILQTQCRIVVVGKTPGDGRARRGSPVVHGYAYAGYLAIDYSMSTREHDSLSKSLPIWSTVLYAACQWKHASAFGACLDSHKPRKQILTGGALQTSQDAQYEVYTMLDDFR